MHPLTQQKIRRLQATIRMQQAIIGKRNQQFHTLRRHFENPITTIGIMVKLDEIKVQWKEKGFEPIDFVVLLGVRDLRQYNIFYREDVEAIVLAHPTFYEHTRHNVTGVLNRLINKGYVRKYTKRKQDNYFVTTEGRLLLIEVSKRVFKIVRGTMR